MRKVYFKVYSCTTRYENPLLSVFVFLFPFLLRYLSSRMTGIMYFPLDIRPFVFLSYFVCILGKKIFHSENKPDRATMRPGRVSACIDHVTYMERLMDEQTRKTTE